MIRTLDNLDIQNKRVLMRVDFNVPLDEDGNVGDPTRIESVKPTLDEILSKGASVVLMSHLGRPKSKVNPKYSLAPVAKWIEKHWNVPIQFADDCISNNAKNIASNLKSGEILLLENLRFYPGEEANDKEFAQKLSELGEAYVNDAFGVSHRAHASVHAVVEFFGNQIAAGRLLEREVKFLSNAIENPTRPLVAILGGAKISTKITLIENLLNKVDKLLIGGAMAYAFSIAKGGKVGNSYVEKETLSEAERILKSPNANKLLFPVDSANVTNLESKSIGVSMMQDIPDGWMGVDVGDDTSNLFDRAIKSAGTVVWNGPVGMFENPLFAKGTRRIAEKMAEVTQKGVLTIVGGGDTVAALAEFGLTNSMTHVSTGGGASMEMLEGKTLPGAAVLERN